MQGKHQTEVLVVGGGPVGLFTALQLAERGIKVRVIDQDRRTASHSYALVMHPETLRVLFRSGPIQAVLKQAAPLERVAFYEGADRKHELELPEGEGSLPFALVLPQSSLEQVLEAELARWDVHVEWNHRLTAIEPQADHVDVEISRLDRAASGYPYARMEWIVSKTSEVRARYLVGADGYNSFVRRQLDIPYVSHGPSLSFSVFEFAAETLMPPEVRVGLNAETTEVLWPIANDRFRFSFSIEDVARHDGSIEALRAFIAERAPWFDADPTDVRWSTSVLFEQRLAERFGEGRVWLVGDAAHITGPIGGQSMNVGLIEGRELASAIGTAQREGSEAGDPLADYDTHCRAVWRALLDIDDTLCADETAEPWVAERAKRILPCLPASGDDLTGLLGRLGLTLG